MPRSLTLSLLLFILVLRPILAGEGPTTPNPGLKYYYPVPKADPPQTLKVDVCVYGGTPGGVAAAVQARRMGKTTVLAVFRRHVGGLTSAGLTAVDFGKAESIGGMAVEFLKTAGKRPGTKATEVSFPPPRRSPVTSSISSSVAL